MQNQIYFISILESNLFHLRVLFSNTYRKPVFWTKPLPQAQNWAGQTKIDLLKLKAAQLKWGFKDRYNLSRPVCPWKWEILVYSGSAVNANYFNLYRKDPGLG